MPEKWIQSVCNWYTTVPAHSACFVGFPEYRPDLVRKLAQALAATQIDFRAVKMAPLGWQATSLPLSALDEAASAAMQGGGDIVLQNAESLLSSVAPEQRHGWFQHSLKKRWQARLVVPLTLYAHELRQLAGALLHEPSALDLPEDSLLERLSSLQ